MRRSRSRHPSALRARACCDVLYASSARQKTGLATLCWAAATRWRGRGRVDERAGREGQAARPRREARAVIGGGTMGNLAQVFADRGFEVRDDRVPVRHRGAGPAPWRRIWSGSPRSRDGEATARCSVGCAAARDRRRPPLQGRDRGGERGFRPQAQGVRNLDPFAPPDARSGNTAVSINEIAAVTKRPAQGSACTSDPWPGHGPFGGDHRGARDQRPHVRAHRRPAGARKTR